MRIKKHMLIVITMILLLAFACGCSSNVNKTDDSIDEEFMEQYILSTYFLDDILDLYEEKYPETFRDSLMEYVNNRFDGLPNIPLIMEEIEQQGHQEEYAKFFQIADKIGYGPSVLVGEQCLDLSTNIIHLTDGPCLFNIKSADMVFLCETSIGDLLKDMENEDAYINKCTLCEDCWEIGSLEYLKEN